MGLAVIDDIVVAGAAGEDFAMAGAAITDTERDPVPERIVTVAAKDHVATIAGVDHIVAAAAAQQVLRVTAAQKVIFAAAA